MEGDKVNKENREDKEGQEKDQVLEKNEPTGSSTRLSFDESLKVLLQVLKEHKAESARQALEFKGYLGQMTESIKQEFDKQDLRMEEFKQEIKQEIREYVTHNIDVEEKMEKQNIEITEVRQTVDTKSNKLDKHITETEQELEKQGIEIEILQVKETVQEINASIDDIQKKRITGFRIQNSNNHVNLIQNFSRYDKYEQPSFFITDINTTVHSSIHFTSQKLKFGSRVESMLDKLVTFSPVEQDNNWEVKLGVARSIIQNNADRRKRKNDRKKLRVYQVEDAVLIQCHMQSSAADRITKKVCLIFGGPFKVKEKVAENVYLVVNPDMDEVRGTFNVRSLRPYFN